jgi:hypothetical protein
LVRQAQQYWDLLKQEEEEAPDRKPAKRKF